MIMSNYKVAANMEWTSKCNARCVMCPQNLIQKPQLMKPHTFAKTLERLSPDDLFRVVVAGYGEPTTHPHFMGFMSAIGEHPVGFGMVSNGQELDEQRLRYMDGKIGLLVISFSSIAPSVYNRVHVNLDHERVKNNICLAQKVFKKTRLAISLTPLEECLETLPETIKWLQEQGVKTLTMSPTLYNRAGNMNDHEQSTLRLREIIAKYQLHSQEMDFIPSLHDTFQQLWRNKFKCMPRNSDVFITSSGNYLYCYNDISHTHTIGHVDDLSVRKVLALREKMAPIDGLCDGCNMRDRYKPQEIIQVAGKYMADKIISRFAG